MKMKSVFSTILLAFAVFFTTSVNASAASGEACTGKYYSIGDNATMTVQVAKNSNTRTLQWGLQLDSGSRSKFGDKVTTQLLAARINYSNINLPYAPHTEKPNYNFHGSLKNYQLIGGGGGTLKKGDKVYLNFQIFGSNNKSDKLEMLCDVE
ncbi:hypothetical protein [Viridibacillus arvi]|uniref:hypothetical protein n=1 Tax=Viridibacillus arvi TaxID=263475 RepID=UPI0006A9AA61|nr:hypothetical protein [Viridibacillus arvi]